MNCALFYTKTKMKELFLYLYHKPTSVNSTAKAHILRTLFLMLCLLNSVQASAQLTYLNRSTPEEEGLRSRDVLNFVDTLMRQKDTDMHGIMVLRNGKVIAEKYNEPFGPQYSHTLYSCSKTFTAVGIGLCIQDSLLKLDDKLVNLVDSTMLPPIIGDSLAAITIENLLTMQSGLPIDTKMRTVETEWVKAYLSHRMTNLPGKKFAYDSIDSYLLAAVVQKVTGKTLFALLRERIFTPMGITQVAWEESPEGITCGGWGLYLQLESMAKFGQLLLQKGEWNGNQLVSSEWVNEMMKHRATNTGGTKYGYQIWIMDHPGMVRCDGAYGQFIYIVPDRQMVVAMTQCMRGNANLEHKMVWNLSRKSSNKPLPASAELKILQNSRYRLTPVRGRANNSKRIFPFRVRLGSNILKWKEIAFEVKGNQLAMNPIMEAVVTTESGETFNMTFGYRNWHLNEIKGKPLNIRSFKNEFSNIKPPFYASASYAWQGDDDLQLQLHYVNWLTSCNIQFHFGANNVKANITTSDTTRPTAIAASLIK